MAGKALGWIAVASLLAVSTVSADFRWPFSSRSSKAFRDDTHYTRYPIDAPPLPQAWGRPLDGGPIRTLFVVPRFTVGDVRDLASRLDLEPEVVAFWDATHLGPPEGTASIPHTSDEETLARFAELLVTDNDVIVWANVDATALPNDRLQDLFNVVQAGTGLILVNHRHTDSTEFLAFLNALKPTGDASVVTRGIGAALTPEWSSGLGFVQTARYGEGRVVELDYPGPPPRYHCLAPAVTRELAAAPEFFDTYLSLVARAVCWAANRDPQARIASVQGEPQAVPDAINVPVGLVDAEAAQALGFSRQHQVRPYWVYLHEPARHPYIVRTRLRQPGRGMPMTTVYDEDPLREGESSYRVYVVAGAGEYYLDVWLLDRNEVVDWYTEIVTVDAWPSVNNLTANKPAVHSQDTLGLTFMVPPRAQSFTVQARATDSRGRIVSKTDRVIAPNVGIAQLGLDVTDLVPGMLKVEVFANGREVPALADGDLPYSAYGHVYVPVTGAVDTRQFALAASMDGSAEYGARRSYQALAAAGIDQVYTAGTEAAVQYLARAGLVPITEIATYVPERVTGDHIRVPCLNDPAWQQEEADRLRAAMQAILFAGSSTVSLGDGNCLATQGEPVCQSPYTREGYWAYLRDQYGSLGAVNRAWGTAFVTWDNITAPPREAVSALRAYAPWVDFRLFMDTVFADAHATARELIRESDNRSSVGFGATAGDDGYTGYNWQELVDRVDWLILPVDERSVEQFRCFRGPNVTAGLSVPMALQGQSGAHARWYPWYAVLHGMNRLVLPQVLAGSSTVPDAPLLGPAGAWTPQAPQLFVAASELKSGIAHLLLDATRENPGVAICVSRPSYYLNVIDTTFGAGSSFAEKRFADALTALGYPHDYVSSDQVRQGDLDSYKLVILPMARALADDELAAIQAFHDRGGGVVADIAPGAFDEHGTPRPAPPLAPLFGVRHTRPSEAGPAADALVQIDLAGSRVSADFNAVVPDSSVEAAEAAVGGLAGMAPVWMIHRGPGLAVLINHTLPASDVDDASDAYLRTLLRAILQETGVEPPVDITFRDGEALQGEVFGFISGDARVIALLADPDADSQRLEIVFPDGEAVYDVRAGKRVKRPQSQSVELAPGAALVYAVLPYEAATLSVESLNEVVAGSRIPFVTRLAAKQSTPASNVVHVELLPIQKGQAEAPSHYTRDVVCRDGTGEGFIRLALDERPGVYKLVARDVLTGLSAETTVTVLSP